MHDIIELFRKELVCVACLKDNTVKVYISSIYRYSRYAADVKSFDPLKPKSSDLFKWLMFLKKTGTRFLRLGNYQIALKKFFIFAGKLGIIKYNPALDLIPVRKVKSTLNQPVSVKSACELLNSFDQSSWLGSRNFTIVSILWALGLRLSECLDLKIENFDPEYNRPEKVGALLIHGKGLKQRTLFVVDKLYDNLNRYLKLPESPSKNSNFMFPPKQHYDRPVSNDRVLKIIKQTAKEAGIKERITPHVLRHTFATHMYEKGVPAQAISRMMGHVSIEETAIYIHVSEDMKKRALNKITIPGR